MPAHGPPREGFDPDPCDIPLKRNKRPALPIRGPCSSSPDLRNSPRRPASCQSTTTQSCRLPEHDPLPCTSAPFSSRSHQRQGKLAGLADRRGGRVDDFAIPSRVCWLDTTQSASEGTLPQAVPLSFDTFPSIDLERELGRSNRNRGCTLVRAAFLAEEMPAIDRALDAVTAVWFPASPGTI